MKYKVNVDVHRWVKDEVVSEDELLSEGVVVKDWIDRSLLVLDGGVVIDSDLDLNKDGKVDGEDASIAGRVLSDASRKKRRRGRR